MESYERRANEAEQKLKLLLEKLERLEKVIFFSLMLYRAAILPNATTIS